MNHSVILVSQAIGAVSALVLAGAVGLIALRSGRSIGEAVAYGLGMVLLNVVVPYTLRAVVTRSGMPMESVILVYPVCSLLAAFMVLSLALRRWPRPQ